MFTKRLNLLDTAWLSAEKSIAPMHVGGLLTFILPANAPADFGRCTTAHWHKHANAFAPWNHRLRSGWRICMSPSWELLDTIDAAYHCRYAAMPACGPLRLRRLVARLHSRPLDLSRPPWECYLIDGLSDRRFAIYIKMHHALVDGVAGMRLLVRSLADSAADHDRPPFWAVKPRSPAARPSRSVCLEARRATTRIVASTRHPITSLAGFVRAGHVLVKAARCEQPSLARSHLAPASILNGRIQDRRGYATQRFSLVEVKTLASVAGVSVNDIVLAICAGALRQYLGELGQLPARPLTAGIPVSIRPANDQGYGNALTFITATLATHILDPEQRLHAIARSTRRAKRQLAKLPRAAIKPYTVALMGPYLLLFASGLAGRTRPLFNVTISNVPGPPTKLYLRGAMLEAFYPASLVTHGQALNITVHSYVDTLGFGFIACCEAVASVQRLADYTGEALEELRSRYRLDAGPGHRRDTTEPKCPAVSRRRIDDPKLAYGTW